MFYLLEMTILNLDDDELLLDEEELDEDDELLLDDEELDDDDDELAEEIFQRMMEPFDPTQAEADQWVNGREKV